MKRSGNVAGKIFNLCMVLTIWALFFGVAISKATDASGPGNPPTVDAGPDWELRLSEDRLVITADANVQNGDIAFYYWAQIAGPSPAGMLDSFNPTLHLYDLQPGTYHLRLVVIDNHGQPAEDDVLVHVRGDSAAL